MNRRLTSSSSSSPTPAAAEVTTYITQIDAALNEAVKRFGVDIAKSDAPAMTPGPIR